MEKYIREAFCPDRTDCRMYAAEDCMVFIGQHFCCCGHFKDNAQLMATEAAKAGMTKVVIFGDCDDHYDGHEKALAEIMTSAGLESVWFPDEMAGEALAEDTLACAPAFLQNFKDAEKHSKLRRMLGQAADRVRRLRYQIKDEARLLQEYPVVARLVSVEFEDWRYGGPDDFEILFGERPDTLVSETNAVALFNVEKQTGVLVTEAKVIEFTVPPAYRDQGIDVPGFKLDRLQEKGYLTGKGGSVRVKIGNPEYPLVNPIHEIKLYCHPGVFEIESHPELNTSNLNVSYEPMWHRVRGVRK